MEHLILLASNPNGDFEDFFVSIAKGFARSSKRILYHPEHEEFSIINEIDESFQEFHVSEIEKHTNLIEAIQQGALFKVYRGSN
ncbi:hypothetical protein [Confluentibacter flavum]|uniref:hypothetical protein n=1 Tax=Confluentibacter flavum TaxID=1909700 RepID=UPI0012FEC4ED|nr:hypothetical protein [Confluentibacter flavum]